MNKIKNCENCGRVNAKLTDIKEEYNVNGEIIHIETKAYICPKCKKTLFDMEADEETLKKIKEKLKK